MAPIILTSPMQGWAGSLDDVPDQVFAERMMGDGVAIDPTGDCLHAPCDGVVLSLHASGHAITLRSPEGVEILIHVGLDTVALGGRGFTPLIAEGASVDRGDPLIRFDLDLLVCGARAVVTPVIVTNPERFTIQRRECGRLIGMGETLMMLTANDGTAIDTIVAGDSVRRTIVVPLVHGIHARPAARIGAAARAFVSEVSVAKDDREASVRSPVRLMALGVRLGDRVTIAATGPDAAEALAAVADLILGGMNEAAGSVAAETAPAATPRPAAAPAPADGSIPGITASPGDGGSLRKGADACRRAIRPSLWHDLL